MSGSFRNLRMFATDNANVGGVFDDFKGRRVALIKALTDEQDKFFQLCDPEKNNLCLYGFTNGEWEVNVPSESVPPELPEPVLGINFARDGMQRKAWLSLVAIHCDCWLKAVAYYFGASFGFKKNERKELFDMINDLPTVFDVVNMELKDHSSNSNPSKSNSSKNMEPRKSEQPKAAKMASEVEEREEEEEEEDEEDEQDATMCGACGNDYEDDNAEEFWICCDMCERWFHGKCVKITPKKAANIKKYMCPDCSINKRVKV